MDNYKNWSDESLKCKSCEIIAFGALPLEKWGPYFATEKYMNDIPLREKAFAIWFYTLLDFVGNEDIFDAMCSEMKLRKFETEALVNAWGTLSKLYKTVLSLYSKEEQLFLSYIRDHAVHGSISLWSVQKFNRTWYEAKTNKVVKEKVQVDDYRKMINPQFAMMPKTTVLLLERLLQSVEFSDLTKTISERFSRNNLINLARQTGVTVNDHTS